MKRCEGIPNSTATTSTSTAREFKSWRLKFVRRLRSCCPVKQRVGLDGHDLAAPAEHEQSHAREHLAGTMPSETGSAIVPVALFGVSPNRWRGRFHSPNGVTR